MPAARDIAFDAQGDFILRYGKRRKAWEGQLDPHNVVTNPAPITNVNDYNRDGSVNSTDQVTSRNNTTNAVTSALKFLTVGAGAPFAPAVSTDTPSTSNAAFSVPDSRLDEAADQDVAFALGTKAQPTLQTGISTNVVGTLIVDVTRSPLNTQSLSNPDWTNIMPCDLDDEISKGIQVVDDELVALLAGTRY